MNAWQSIETAPKDGEMILLCLGRFVYPGWWDSAEQKHPWRIVDSTVVLEADQVQVNGWMDGVPTHWQPMPQGAEA